MSAYSLYENMRLLDELLELGRDTDFWNDSNNKEEVNLTSSQPNTPRSQRKTRSDSLEALILSIKQKNTKVKDRLFICDHPNCSKKYNQKYRLQIHKRSHVKIYKLFILLI